MRRIVQIDLKVLITLGVLIYGSALSAQVEKDFEARAEVSYETDLVDDFELSLSQEFRMEDNARVFGKSYTTVGLQYKLRRWIRFGLNYRYIFNRRSNGSYRQSQRVMADLTLRAYQHQFTFDYQVRLQSEANRYNYEREYGFAPTTELKNTFEVAYTVNRFYQVYASFDLRWTLYEAEIPNFKGINRTKSTVGVSYLLAENRELELYFMTERHLNTTEPDRIFVLGVELSFGSRSPLFGP